MRKAVFRLDPTLERRDGSSTRRSTKWIFCLTTALLLLFVGFACPTIASIGEWTNNGPPAVIQSLAVGPGPAATAYAGTPDGLYRSVDHGRTWQRMASSLGVQGVTALAIDPENPSILYAASARDGIFRSTDGGATFAPSSVGLLPFCFVGRILIARSNPSTLYSSGCGVYRSDDAGANWVRASFGRNVGSLAVHPLDSRKLVAGTDWGRPTPQDVYAGIFLTDDGGANWRPAPGQPTPSNQVTDLQIDSTNPARILATHAGVEEISRSEDGGETWLPSNNGYRGYIASAIVFDPFNASLLYVTAHDPPSVTGVPPPDVRGVYRSVDGGQSWIRFGRGQRPGEDLLAIDPTGRFVYSASFGTQGVFVIEAPVGSSDIPSLGDSGKLTFALALAAVGAFLLYRAK